MSDSLSLMALDFMKSSGGCTVAAAVARRFGVSQTQASHALRALVRRGLACVAVADSWFKVYCLNGTTVDDAFATVPCFQHLKEAFARIAEGHRGKVALISAADLAAILAERCGVSMNMMIFPVRTYLDAAVAPHALSVSRGGKYVVPTELLYRFAESPPKVPAKCARVLKVWRQRPRIRMEATTVKLPPEVIEALDRVAEARGINRSAVIREALAEWLNHCAANATNETAQPTTPAEEDDDMPVIEGR